MFSYFLGLVMAGDRHLSEFEIVLDSRMVKFLRTRYGEKFRCNKCEEDFTLGETIVSKIHSRTRSLYHRKCFDSLFVKV
jgi:hypothetical protein